MHRPQPVSMMAFPGSCSKRHVSSSSSGSSEIRVSDARCLDNCSISRRSSSSVFVFRLAERSSFVTNTFAWDTDFFWRRSGQSLLKCPMRRQRKHLVLRRICSLSGAGVCELELWLKLRSHLTMCRFCRDSFQVTRVRTASSSSIGQDSSVVFPKFVIRASISLSRVHFRHRLLLTFRQRAGCAVRSPPPLPPNHAATWCPRRPVFQKSRRPTIARPCHKVSSSPLLQRLQPLLVSDVLSLQRSACGHRTLTSIQSCCRTPGNQETTPGMAHRILGAASLLSLSQS